MLREMWNLTLTPDWDQAEAAMQAYQAHNQSVSESVQLALEQLLDGSPSPPPVPVPPATSTVDPLVRAYVQDLAFEVEMMRRSMQGAMLPVPYPLAPPPWLGQSKAAEWPPERKTIQD